MRLVNQVCQCQIIHKGSGHEQLTIKIIEGKDLLGKLVDDSFFAGCSSVVARIIKGGDVLEPQLKVLKDIISGQMDADRADYLLRDSHHCGVEYGIFDYRRMVECLTILEGPGESLEIALDRDGLHTFEALILARYQMNSQVYFHRIRRIYDYYLQEYFKETGHELFGSPEKILAQNDVTTMAKMMSDASDGPTASSKWAQRIASRSHHREIHATGANTNATDLRASKEVLEKLRGKFSAVDFIWDKSEAKIHSLLLPDDMEEGSWVQLQVIDKRGTTKLMGDQSHILRHVPRSFQVARIFADVEESDDTRRQELRDYAATEYAKLGGR